MLLLILLAGCLASCAAQTTSFPTSLVSATTTAVPPTQVIQPTTVISSTSPEDNVVAILETAVKSSLELNETMLGPVLGKIHDIIREFQADLDITLTVKNITKV